MTQPTPQLHLTPDKVICSLHGAMFKPQWPLGYPVFVMQALEGLKQCAVLDTIDGDAESIDTLLAARPLCCRLRDEDPELLLLIFNTVNELVSTHDPAAELWVRRKCGRCNRMGEGCKFELVPPYSPHGRGRRIQRFGHLCLRCAATGGVTRGGPAFPK